MGVDDSYTKSLIHFDDGHGITTVVDESGKAWTAHGDFAGSNVQSVFGGLSGVFDGLGDYIDTPPHADWNVAANNFTISFRVRPTANAIQTYFSMGDGTTNNFLKILAVNAGTLQVQALINSGGSQVVSLTSSVGHTVNTWKHYALVRYGSSFTLYIDGANPVSTTWAGSIGDPTAISISGYRTGGADENCAAYMDEFRFSRTARWLSAFTPQTFAYTPGVVLDASTAPLVVASSFTGALSRLIPETPFVVESIFVATLSALLAWPTSIDLVTELSVTDVHATTILRGSLPMLTCVATGAVRSGIIRENLPAISILASGLTGNIGGIRENLPALTIAAYGGATLRANLPMPTMASTGTLGSVGRISAQLPLMTASGSVLVGTVGRIQKTLPSISMSGQTYNNPIGGIAADLPILTCAATGLSGAVGSLKASLPAITMSVTSFLSSPGVLRASLPGFYINAHGINIPLCSTFDGVVMNLKNMAVSEYDGFAFNSFAWFNGQYLGAKDDGIYPLVGEHDDGADIEARITLGAALTGGQKPRDIHIFAGGEQTRVKVPRGTKSNYFQVAVANQDGEDLDIDCIQVFSETLTRRKK